MGACLMSVMRMRHAVLVPVWGCSCQQFPTSTCIATARLVPCGAVVRLPASIPCGCVLIGVIAGELEAVQQEIGACKQKLRGFDAGSPAWVPVQMELAALRQKKVFLLQAQGGFAAN